MGRFLLLRNPSFGNFWVARLVSYFGSAVTVAALVLYVYETEGTGVAVGLLLLAETLPRLFGPFAGALADRADGRRFMILCDLGQAVLIGCVALTLPPFAVLVALVAGASVLSTLFFPAGRSAVPALVPDEDLTPANALLGSAANLSFALGPAAGALLFAGIGARGALALDALTFLVSAALLSRLPALPPAGEARPGSRTVALLRESRDGLLFVARHRLVRVACLGLFLGVVFLALDGAALVFLAREALGAGETGYGLLASAHGVGMILGPLLLLRGSARVAPVSVILLGLTLEGLTTLSAGLAPSLALAICLRGIGGVGNGIENVAADTLLQKVVPRSMLGRVFGVYYGGVFLAEGLAYAAGGPLVELTSPRVVFVIAGCGTLAAMLLVWRLLPRPAGEARGGEGSGRTSI
jgi:MFS family permease